MMPKHCFTIFKIYNVSYNFLLKIEFCVYNSKNKRKLILVTVNFDYINFLITSMN